MSTATVLVQTQNFFCAINSYHRWTHYYHSIAQYKQAAMIQQRKW